MGLTAKSNRLEGLRIAHCVTGSVAAIEAPRVSRELRRHGAHVHAYMSGDAAKIIHPYVMEFATGTTVITELTGKMEHLSSFDLVLVAPATATTIGKMAAGIADSVVTALTLATKAKIVIAPAMDLGMYENPLVRENVEKLKKAGCVFVEPKVEEEKAKLPVIDDIVEAVLRELGPKDLEGLKVLVTAGPTLEYIDPIRVISNKSSGKMGVEIALEARARGADVRMVYGLGKVEPPSGISVTRVETSDEMLAAVQREIRGCDVFISAAAVGDFTTKMSPRKIETRAGGIALKLTPTKKILARVKTKGKGPLRVAFKALDRNGNAELTKASRNSLEEYDVDVAVANNATKTMGSDSAEVCIATKKSVIHIPLTSKTEVARKLWDIIAGLKGK